MENGTSRENVKGTFSTRSRGEKERGTASYPSLAQEGGAAFRPIDRSIKALPVDDSVVKGVDKKKGGGERELPKECERKGGWAGEGV